jgi:hypothetical protein
MTLCTEKFLNSKDLQYVFGCTNHYGNATKLIELITMKITKRKHNSQNTDGLKTETTVLNNPHKEFTPSVF